MNVRVQTYIVRAFIAENRAGRGATRCCRINFNPGEM